MRANKMICPKENGTAISYHMVYVEITIKL
jgi:hypothetical protein